MTDSFIFYRSFSEAISELTDEQAGKFVKILSDYALDNVEPEKLEGIIKIVFCLVKPQIDANSKRRNVSNGGGAPVGNQNAKKQPSVELSKTKKQPSVDFIDDEKQPNDNDNDNDNVNEKENDNTPAEPEETPDGISSPSPQKNNIYKAVYDAYISNYKQIFGRDPNIIYSLTTNRITRILKAINSDQLIHVLDEAAKDDFYVNTLKYDFLQITGDKSISKFLQTYSVPERQEGITYHCKACGRELPPTNFCCGEFYYDGEVVT